MAEHIFFTEVLYRNIPFSYYFNVLIKFILINKFNKLSLINFIVLFWSDIKTRFFNVYQACN